MDDHADLKESIRVTQLIEDADEDISQTDKSNKKIKLDSLFILLS